MLSSSCLFSSFLLLPEGIGSGRKATGNFMLAESMQQAGTNTAAASAQPST